MAVLPLAEVPEVTEEEMEVIYKAFEEEGHDAIRLMDNVRIPADEFIRMCALLARAYPPQGEVANEG